MNASTVFFARLVDAARRVAIEAADSLNLHLDAEHPPAFELHRPGTGALVFRALALDYSATREVRVNWEVKQNAVDLMTSSGQFLALPLAPVHAAWRARGQSQFENNQNQVLGRALVRNWDRRVARGDA